MPEDHPMRTQGSFLKNSRGAVAPITIVLMVAFFALLAIVIDLGHLMLVRNQLQNAADAGALAGARALFLNNSTSTPAWATGQAAAIATVQANKADTLTLAEPSGNVQTGYWDTTWTPATAPAQLLSTGIIPGPTDAAAVKVTVQKNATSNGPVALTFAQIFGLTTVNVAAHATAIVSPTSGPFAYALFSNLNLSITGAENITGSVFTNNNLTINGAENISGAAVGVTGVSLTGAGNIGSVVAGTTNEISDSGAFSIGSESGGAQIIPLSNYNYTSQIENTAATTINGNWTQSGALNISGNMYVTGTATINGAINDSGAILANGNITVTGAANISGSGQIFIYSANGNITINGATNFGTGNSSAILYAPNGTVTIIGASNINGGIIANQITLPGVAFNVNGGFPIQLLQQFAPPELVQ